MLAAKGDFMSVTTMTLPIDAELESWLAKNAAAQGVKAEQFAVEALQTIPFYLPA
jgi:hypothetical protein